MRSGTNNQIPEMCRQPPQQSGWKLRLIFCPQMANPKPGQIGWLDITAPEADTLRDFYSTVVGWTASPISMGEYNDYAMSPGGDGKAVTGICHARDGNATIPTAWVPYFVVADADKSLTDALARGAEVIRPMTSYGPDSKYCVLRDPAGAVFAVFQAASE